MLMNHMKINKLSAKANAFGKLALLAAAVSMAGATGLYADDVISGTREFKEAKELDGEGTLWIARDAVLKFTGEKATIARVVEIQPSGRRRHGYGIINVVNPKGELTLKVLLGNNEYNVYRRLEKSGPGTLILDGDEDNSGAKLVVKDGTVILGKASDPGTHAQGGTGWLEIYGDAKAGTVGTVRLAGTGGDQIADEGNVILKGGVFDANIAAETLNSFAFEEGGTIRFAYSEKTGKTGTLTVTGEDGFRVKEKNYIAIDNPDSWKPGVYDLIVASEEILATYFTNISLSPEVKNAKLALSANKRAIQLVVEKK